MSNLNLKAGMGVSLAVVAAAAGIFWFSSADAGAAEVVVYQNPACGCCHLWTEHLESNGFEVRQEMEGVNEMKARHGIGPELAACHTAIVDGYVVEGHVPAEDIRRLLAERPDVVGIAVPGMPAGSPGMEGPTRERYDVLTFDADGNTTVFASH